MIHKHSLQGMVPMFQFPSNGKAYPKHKLPQPKQRPRTVSIPFKRESVSKGIKYTDETEPLNSFNSLQTGKRIQRRLTQRSIPRWILWFQFPSNGKAYPKVLPRTYPRSGEESVSIPFKRESVSKVRSFDEGAIKTKFQFPSNGKAYPKGNLGGKSGCREQVSIPFKRESVSKVIKINRKGR